MPRGVYGNKRMNHRPYVGISLFHTVGDRDRAVDETNTAIVTVVSELLTRMGVNPNVFSRLATDPKSAAEINAAHAKIQQSPLFPIWNSLVKPTYDEWNAFYNDQSSWNQFTTNWETYEHWQERITNLRAAVNAALREHGQQLASADPGKLSSTLPGAILDTSANVVKKVGEGAANAAGETWTLVKIGIYGALGIGGVIAISSIVQQLRKDRDPLETYAGIARGALPAGPSMKQLRGG